MNTTLVFKNQSRKLLIIGDEMGGLTVKLKAIYRRQLQMHNVPVYEFNIHTNCFEYEDLVFIEYVTHSYTLDEMLLDSNWEVYLIKDDGEVCRLLFEDLFDTVNYLKEKMNIEK